MSRTARLLVSPDLLRWSLSEGAVSAGLTIDSVLEALHLNLESPASGQVPPRFSEQRQEMIEAQIRRRGVHDARVLSALAAVARHEFVGAEVIGRAYEDEPLPIGQGQTISQPYMVAAMTAALRLEGHERVLEIGTGCGYQAAVLSCLAKEVFTIERLPALAEGARACLTRLGFATVRVFCQDGTLGLAEFAPYDGILVAAAAPAVPEPLVEQLAVGGRMIVPIGTQNAQRLVYVVRQSTGLTVATRESCRFVPLVGEHGWKDREP